MEEKLFEGQYDDEEVELVFHQHPIVLRKPLVIFMIILLVGALPLALWPTVNYSWYSFFGGILIGSLAFAYFFMSWYFSIYVITNQRVIHVEQTGFFRKQVVELGHDKIQNVNYEVPGFLATAFHYGTIVIQTFVGDLVLDTIHHPEKIHRSISKIIREHKPTRLPGTEEEE